MALEVLPQPNEGRSARSGEDQRLRRTQCGNETSRIAGRQHDDAIVDAGFVQRLAQILRADEILFLVVHLHVQAVVFGTVGGDEQQQCVFLAIHMLADRGKRVVEIVVGRQWGVGMFAQVVRVVDQRDHAPARIEALLEQLLEVERLVAEDIVAGIAGKTDHVQIGDAWALRLQRFQRLRQGGLIDRIGLIVILGRLSL